MVSRRKAERLSKQILDELKPYIKKGIIAGSIRRGEEKVKDIDLVVIPKKVWDTEGRRIFSGKVDGVGLQVYVTDKKEFASTLFQRTGPKGHNIGIAIKAKKLGMRWHGDHGLSKNGHHILTKSEKEIYHLIQTPFKPPHLRGK